MEIWKFEYLENKRSFLAEIKNIFHSFWRVNVCYFSLFLKEECISSLFWTKYIEKKFNLQFFFFPLFHEHSHSLELPCTAHPLKNFCFEKKKCNQDYAHDVDIFPDEKIMNRSEPTNQVQTKINIMKGLQTYLNDLKNYLTTYEGFKIRRVILKILGKYWFFE